MRELSAVESAIDAVVRRRFGAGQIGSVFVRPDVDSDGDKILRIDIVMQGGIEELDSRRMVGLVRHIRSALTGEFADSFPIVSYIAKSEAAKLSFEAA